MEIFASEVYSVKRWDNHNLEDFELFWTYEAALHSAKSLAENYGYERQKDTAGNWIDTWEGHRRDLYGNAIEIDREKVNH